ncbi:MAG: hypothetical protein G01um101470_848 [Parcubacteria group bacterium Gr01-1014_70]|nr:MAG: hypothetical protein G01um101470_848 [Parcubacteria group bacterium Gr01-1014_70]
MGGYIGVVVFRFVVFLSGFDYSVGEGLGFGSILYGFLPGIILVYSLLRKFFPSLLGIK